MTYYTKGENGEYSDATEEVNSLVKSRLDKYKKSAIDDIRKEAEEGLKAELTTSITKETEDKLKGEYQSKLDEATNTAKTLEVSLRRKTIAAEYGFKPEAEKYLGEGSEEDMRKEADNLKNNFTASTNAPDKHTGSGESPIQQRTGIKVEI